MQSTKLALSLLAVLFLPGLQPPVQAQITQANDGTGTIPSPTGGTFNITGGTLSGNNLFHSFTDFGLNAGQTANFVQPNAAIQNILSRVVGGNPSVIDGTLQVTGGNANLYLMNPSGIIFGAGSRLDVAGTFVGTTANGIGFGNGKWFSASGSNSYADLSGTPTQFAFTTDQAGAIIVNPTDDDAFTNNLDSSGMVLIGGSIVSNTPVLKVRGDLGLAAVKGQQIVTLKLRQPGQLLSLEVQSIVPGASLPNNWSLPIQSLPALLTGGGITAATEVRVDATGNVFLTSTQPGSPETAVKPGDIAVRSIFVEKSNNSNNNAGSLSINAANTFRAIDTISNGQQYQDFVSIRADDRISIKQGGSEFIEAIGFQKNANGTFQLYDRNGKPVFLKGTKPSDIGNVNNFVYADGQVVSDLDLPIGGILLNTPVSVNGETGYSKGLIVIQNSTGNGLISGTTIDTLLPNPTSIEVVVTRRLPDPKPPDPKLPDPKLPDPKQPDPNPLEPTTSDPTQSALNRPTPDRKECDSNLTISSSAIPRNTQERSTDKPLSVPVNPCLRSVQDDRILQILDK